MVPQESIVRPDDVPLPDEVQWLLESVATAEQTQPGRQVLVKVRLSALQALSEKVRNLVQHVTYMKATLTFFSGRRDGTSRQGWRYHSRV